MKHELYASVHSVREQIESSRSVSAREKRDKTHHFIPTSEKSKPQLVTISRGLVDAFLLHCLFLMLSITS